jgi:hypothetical protein
VVSIFFPFPIACPFMPVPPKYGDVGKSANDLLNKDYPVGTAKLEVKTVAANGVVCFSIPMIFYSMCCPPFAPPLLLL